MANPDNQTGGEDILSHEADFRLTRHMHKDQGDQWWSLLLEIEGSIDAFIENAARLGARTRAPNLPEIPDAQVAYLVPVAYTLVDRAAHRDTQPVSLFARKSLIDRLNRLPKDSNHANLWHVRSLLLGAPVRREVLDFGADWPDSTPHAPLNEDATVMAVIDDGIAIAHDLFRSGPVSSRIAYASILDATPWPMGPSSTVGRVLETPQIDRLLRECTFGAFLDEDMFYAASGQIRPAEPSFSTVALRSSHGSHVLGLAAGQPWDKAEAERPVLCVSLPSRMTEDTSGQELLPSFYLGFQMLMHQARRFRTRSGALAKVVFNLSYGNSGGPHDGTGVFARLFEHYFGTDARTRQAPQTAWLMLPAGNANLGQLHAVAPAQTPVTQLDLSVLPDDRTVNAVQIWLPYRKADASPVEVRVTAPDGQSHALRSTGRPVRSFSSPSGAEIARLSYALQPGLTQRGLVQLSINPTASLHAAEPCAPSGLWRIEIHRSADASEDVEIWVRRDESLPGLRPGGRQAYLDNPGYQRFGDYGQPLRSDPPNDPCPVKRAGSLSGFACGQSPVVVAAYTARTQSLAPYSASGPCNRPSSEFGSRRDGPDLTAKGSQSDVLGGVLSAGSRSGTLVRRGGTSMSAPRMARAASVAIHSVQGSARDWARDPAAHVPHLRALPQNGPAEPTEAGSGLYSYPVLFGPVPFDDGAE